MKKKLLVIMMATMMLSVTACTQNTPKGDDVDSQSTTNGSNTEVDYDTNNTDNDIEESNTYDGSDSASDAYNVEEGFLYDGACFALYETMGESDDIVYVAEREGKLCISFDDTNYIPLSYSEAKEGYDAYPSDDAESHIIIKETTVNGAFGIEIMSSGSYGKYYGEYIGIPDRD